MKWYLMIDSQIKMVGFEYVLLWLVAIAPKDKEILEIRISKGEPNMFFVIEPFLSTIVDEYKIQPVFYFS